MNTMRNKLADALAWLSAATQRIEAKLRVAGGGGGPAEPF